MLGELILGSTVARVRCKGHNGNYAKNFRGETIFVLRVGVASVVCLQGRQQLTVAGWDRRARPSNENVPFYSTSSRVENVAWCLASYGTGHVLVSLPEPK